MRLYKGRRAPGRRSSPNALYDAALAGFGESGGLFSQQASPGFIELWTLQSRMAYAITEPGKGEGMSTRGYTVLGWLVWQLIRWWRSGRWRRTGSRSARPPRSRWCCSAASWPPALHPRSSPGKSPQGPGKARSGIRPASSDADRELRPPARPLRVLAARRRRQDRLPGGARGGLRPAGDRPDRPRRDERRGRALQGVQEGRDQADPRLRGLLRRRHQDGGRALRAQPPHAARAPATRASATW